MMVLGVSAKDKGAQLEALVHTELESQGYGSVYSNVVGSGGNELDVIGAREVGVMGASHVLPLLCEAKAYADPVDMPTWQKFLGKLFLARADKPATVGMLVALNGVNGNVRGSFASLEKKDEGVFIFDGKQLLRRACEAGEIATEDTVRLAVEKQFRTSTSRVEAAYYGGGYFWVVWWNDEEYSVVDARGNRLPAKKVESLREALAGSVSGSLLAADDAQARAEARHSIKADLINRLLQGSEITLDDAADDNKEVFGSLTQEPYLRIEGSHIELVPAIELDATSIARLFTSLFENRVAVKHLEFMVGWHHDAYVQRLIDTLPERQAGFVLPEDDEQSLRAVAPLFPSVWVTLAHPIPMIAAHRASDPQLTSEAILAADRNAFWDEIIKVVREDFTNIFLRGFLYDYVGLAELDETTEVTIKSKDGVVGTMETKTRTAVRQLADEYVGEAGTRHVLVRILPTVGEPWDDSHPHPVPLGRA
ncbi:MAG TPA: restriction endonuclease [Mycobacterium sp.]|uniref:restriction endonuclease n=1 Tax=Mycobacterium sp. TaxID=1785 RepID=UPI002D2C1183|nr:restriction endonuclease [Mycobacterium sp.]HZU47931.1 restriction endonuclease [Mycobacterium sp.]